MKAIDTISGHKDAIIVNERYLCSNRSIASRTTLAVAIIAGIMVGIIDPWSISPYKYTERHDSSSNGVKPLSKQHPKSKCQSEFLRRSPRLVTLLFITKDGRLLCSKNETQPVMNPRLKHFSDMIRSGLSIHHSRNISKHVYISNETLPLQLIKGDDIGCDVTNNVDELEFPRLTWSMPSQIYHGNQWCNVIGIPSYDIWDRFGNANISKTLVENDRKYRWNKKYSKVVWRGSLTRYNKKYKHVPFEDIPRVKLGKLSLDYPEIIDAALIGIPEGFGNVTDEMKQMTRFADRMPFDDFMNYKGEAFGGFVFILPHELQHSMTSSLYKGIIDVDGNNWSSRFSGLLCTNSVVIKVCLQPR